MNALELKSYTARVTELLERADNFAANGEAREALYDATAAVGVLLVLVRQLAKEQDATASAARQAANVAGCLANGITPD